MTLCDPSKTMRRNSISTLQARLHFKVDKQKIVKYNTMLAAVSAHCTIYGNVNGVSPSSFSWVYPRGIGEISMTVTFHRQLWYRATGYVNLPSGMRRTHHILQEHAKTVEEMASSNSSSLQFPRDCSQYPVNFPALS